jgi:hypothetical protein
VVWEGVGAGGEMTQALYAHMNNKKKKKKKKNLTNAQCKAFQKMNSPYAINIC